MPLWIEILLVELTNDMDDGFWLCCVGEGCFCVFCGVCVGCSWGRQLELHWAEFFFPASYCFCRICLLLKVSVWLQISFFKHPKFMPNLSTYHVVSLSLKTDKSISIEGEKNEYESISISTNILLKVFNAYPFARNL